MKIITKLWTGVIFGILMTGCSLSLAADVTPPPGMSQTQTAAMPTTVSTAVLPMIEPDVSNGELIYQEKCAPCHGDTGMGDGVQSSQLPNPVTPLGDLKIALTAKPIDWYRTVTEGNIDKFMPSFQSLNDRERWDVTAYTLTLSLSNDLVTFGKRVFLENCSECHTEEKIPLQSARSMADLSIVDVLNVISNGNGTEMPAFADAISQEDQLASAVYVRYLGLSEKKFEGGKVDPSGQGDQAGEDEQSSEVIHKTFTFAGSVLNFEPGHEGLTVTLAGYDGMQQVLKLETTVANDGTFEFKDLENIRGRIYQASVNIEKINHMSEAIQDPLIDENGISQLPLLVKKISTDASVLVAERMHVFFDFVDENTIQIVEMYVIQNPGESVIVPADENTPVLSFKLPENAENLQFEKGSIGNGFIKLEDGFGTLLSFAANSSTQILFGYELPYDKGLELDFNLPLPVNASIFMLPANLVKFESDQLTYSGDRNVQGIGIQTYNGGVMGAEDLIHVKLSGKAKVSGTVSEADERTSLIIGGSVLLIVLAGSVFYLRKNLRQNRSDMEYAGDEEDINRLLDSVIALDDSFQRGEISEKAYTDRRNELTALLKRKQESGD